MEPFPISVYHKIRKSQRFAKKIKEKSALSTSSQQDARLKEDNNAFLNISISQNTKKSTVSEKKIKEDVSPTGTNSKALPERGVHVSSTPSISQNTEKSSVSEKKIKEESAPPAGSSINALPGNGSTLSTISISQTSEKSTVSEKKKTEKI